MPNREYKLDKDSYEKFIHASKEEINTLLTNVYNQGYSDCSKENESLINKNDNRFSYEMACKISDRLGQERIKGVGKTSIAKIQDVITSYAGKI
mgnify:CR=1 FL=1